MNCEKFRDIILTDYLDGNISMERKIEVQEHLKQCFECRELEAATRKTAVEPFNLADKVVVPESLWQNIKADIEQEQYQVVGNPFAGLLGRLKNLIIFPKPAFALASATAIIIAAVIITRFNFVNQESAINDYLEEQVNSLAYLEEDGGVYSDTGYLDLGTGIEEFLL
ncbi:MAG: zf-HC2 domain-containing protein [Candidatus Omnitrophota bacterium]